MDIKCELCFYNTVAKMKILNTIFKYFFQLDKNETAYKGKHLIPTLKKKKKKKEMDY